MAFDPFCQFHRFISPAYFDIVLVVGVLHHLDDTEALQLCQLAQAGLKSGGTLITLDGIDSVLINSTHQVQCLKTYDLQIIRHEWKEFRN